MSERQKTAPQARGRRFCHAFEVTQSVYKYARTGFRFGCGCPTQSKAPSRQSCEIAAGVFARM